MKRALFLVLVLMVAASADAGEAEDRAAIEAASRAFSRAYVEQDLDALGDLYTEDARLLPPGGDVVGRAAIRKYFTLGPDRRQLAHSMISDELRLLGTVAIDVGTWSSTSQRGEHEPVTAAGRYLLVWVRGEDGAWRISHDAWHRPQ